MYKDLLLYKICDIYHILLNKNLINWNTIVSTIEEYEMENKLSLLLTYVKGFLNVIFLRYLIKIATMKILILFINTIAKKLLISITLIKS